MKREVVSSPSRYHGAFPSREMVGTPGGAQGREMRARRGAGHAFRGPRCFAPLAATAWGSAVKEMQGLEPPFRRPWPREPNRVQP